MTIQEAKQKLEKNEEVRISIEEMDDMIVLEFAEELGEQFVYVVYDNGEDSHNLKLWENKPEFYPDPRSKADLNIFTN